MWKRRLKSKELEKVSDVEYSNIIEVMLGDDVDNPDMIRYCRELVNRSINKGIPKTKELCQVCASITMKIFYDTGYKNRNIPGKINSMEVYSELELQILKKTLFVEGLCM